jgi:hypothetical protein
LELAEEVGVVRVGKKLNIFMPSLVFFTNENKLLVGVTMLKHQQGRKR